MGGGSFAGYQHQQGCQCQEAGEDGSGPGLQGPDGHSEGSGSYEKAQRSGLSLRMFQGHRPRADVKDRVADARRCRPEKSVRNEQRKADDGHGESLKP